MSRDFLGQFNVSSDMQFSQGILMLEDCEGSMMWMPDSTGSAGVVEFQNTYVNFGTQALSVKTRVASAAEDDNCQATRMLPFPESKLLVLRARMALPVVSVVKSTEMRFSWFAPGVSGFGGMKYDAELGKIYVKTAGDSWVEVAALNFVGYDRAWFDFEIAADLDTLMYKYIMCNGIRSEPVQITNSGSNASDYRHVAVQLEVVAAGSNSAQAVFDSVYVGSYLNL